jgi:hypothetical protein
MKLPQFRLRTLFVLVAILSLPMAWSAYQLNWIHQRKEFLAHHHDQSRVNWQMGNPNTKAPWSLRLFGAPPQRCVICPAQYIEEAKRLFPEASACDSSVKWENML